MSKLIEMGKKYKTRDGNSVRILCVDAKGTHPVIALVNGYHSSFTSYGFELYSNTKGNLDLIEVSPFAEFKKDDKVMVRDSDESSWEKRYFSHEKDGIAYCFSNCETSWTSDETLQWDECRKPTPEELA